MKKHAVQLLLCLLLSACVTSIGAAERQGARTQDQPTQSEWASQWIGDLVSWLEETWNGMPGVRPQLDTHTSNSDFEEQNSAPSGGDPQLSSDMVCMPSPSTDDDSGLPEAGPCIEPVG